ncbi:HEPN domain protein [Candidatus Magnetomorum sp. HK-1]|nr:HEPN domain protein [Candidatus Magnetomorum sp. HK-1]
MKLVDELLNKSKENIEAAKILFNNKLYNASANRSYYAAFHAAIASMNNANIIKINHTELMSHKSVQAIFVKELILKRKTFSSNIKSYLTDLLRVRNIADYHAKGISKKIASRQLNKSVEFVQRLTEEIEK